MGLLAVSTFLFALMRLAHANGVLQNTPGMYTIFQPHTNNDLSSYVFSDMLFIFLLLR